MGCFSCFSIEDKYFLAYKEYKQTYISIKNNNNNNNQIFLIKASSFQNFIKLIKESNVLNNLYEEENLKNSEKNLEKLFNNNPIKNNIEIYSEYNKCKNLLEEENKNENAFIIVNKSFMEKINFQYVENKQVNIDTLNKKIKFKPNEELDYQEKDDDIGIFVFIGKNTPNIQNQKKPESPESNEAEVLLTLNNNQTVKISPVSVESDNKFINKNEKEIEIIKDNKNEGNKNEDNNMTINESEDNYKDGDFMETISIITDEQDEIKKSKVSNSENENNNNTNESYKHINENKVKFNQISDSQDDIEGVYEKTENNIMSETQSDKKSVISNLQIYEGGFIEDSYNNTENNEETENNIRSKTQSEKKSVISNLQIYEGGFIEDSFNNTENKVPENNNSNDNYSKISDGNFIEESVN